MTAPSSPHAHPRGEPDPLDRAESYFDRLADTLPHIVWVSSPDGAVEHFNQYCLDYVGRTREELLEWSWTSQIHPDDVPACLEWWTHSLRTGEPYELEIRIRRASDGAWRWHLARALPLRDATGRIVRWFGTTTDVHDLREAQAALEDAHHALETRVRERTAELEAANVRLRHELAERRRAETERDRLFDLSADMFCIAGFDGVFRQLNPAWEKTLGWTREELMARPYLSFVHPDDLQATMAEAARVEQGQSSLRFENRYRHRDGSWRWIAWSSIPVPEEGLVYAVARDVTAERQVAEALRDSEERYRSLVESAQDGIVTLSPDGTITSANSAFEAITGWRRSDWEGTRFDRLVCPEDRPRALGAFEAALAGESTPGFEVRLRAADGDWVPMEITAAPLSIGERRLGALAIARDIRERIRLEEQVRRIQKLDSIGRLAAGVAHDFNNLLTLQQMNTTLLLTDTTLPEAVTESLEEIAGASRRAAALTRQLLTFSRRQFIQRRQVDLNEISESLTRMLERLLGADVTLSLALDPGAPPVHADAGMIEQVLMNLAVNARDAMPEGGRLTIETATVHLDGHAAGRNPEARAGPFVRLAVSDTGTGIPPEVIDHVFDPFFTTKEVGKGTGLGLATVHGIVQQHQGWIEVRTDPGAGTTFEVYLPASEGAPGAVGDEDEGEARLVGGEQALLVVEDDPALGRMVRRCLERYGYEILMATDGPEALEVWADHAERIDLLLTDMVMPGGMSGRDLSERLRAERPDLEVLFTSGYSADLVGVETGPTERTRFLQKPYDIGTLLKTVRECLATGRAG